MGSPKFYDTGPLFAKAVHISQAKIGPGGVYTFYPDQLSRDTTLRVVVVAREPQ